MTEVRLLNADDVEAYRQIRLEALERHPEAFGTTQAKEAAKPIAELLDKLENHAVFGGFRAERLSGIAVLRRQTIEKERHKATLWGMYVAEAARGTGLAGALVDAVLAYARGRVIQVQLVVGEENISARRLYESRGFKSYGLAPRALKLGDRYLDEYLMVRYLDGGN